MKRIFPLSLAIVLLFFGSSFGQKVKLKPQATDDMATEANKPGPSPPAKTNDYPPLPATLVNAEFERADGTKSKLTDYKGKVVLVNLWGIWCGPCWDEMPRIQTLFNSYHEKGLELLALNAGDHNGLTESPRRMTAFAKRINVTFPFGFASAPFIKELYRLTKQQVVPQTILIDRDGRLRAVFVGGGKRVDDIMAAELERIMVQ